MFGRFIDAPVDQALGPLWNILTLPSALSDVLLLPSSLQSQPWAVAASSLPSPREARRLLIRLWRLSSAPHLFNIALTFEGLKSRSPLAVLTSKVLLPVSLGMWMGRDNT